MMDYYRLPLNFANAMEYETSPVLDLSMKKQRRESVMSEDSSCDQAMDDSKRDMCSTSAKTYKKKLLNRYCKLFFLVVFEKYFCIF